MASKSISGKVKSVGKAQPRIRDSGPAQPLVDPARVGAVLGAKVATEIPAFKHCDDYIHDLSAPLPLRWWLLVNRMPAVDMLLANTAGVRPLLYANLVNDAACGRAGDRVQVVMASRMGDVGITRYLEAAGPDGFTPYETRVPLAELTNFHDGVSGSPLATERGALISLRDELLVDDYAYWHDDHAVRYIERVCEIPSVTLDDLPALIKRHNGE